MTTNPLASALADLRDAVRTAEHALTRQVAEGASLTEQFAAAGDVAAARLHEAEVATVVLPHASRAARSERAAEALAALFSGEPLQDSPGTSEPDDPISALFV